MTFAMLGVVIFVIPIFFVYYSIVGTFGIGLIMTVIMVVTGFLFSSVAAYMAGMVGSSQNPISGITIATILFSSLLLLWFMGASVVGAAAAIMIGSVVCCSAAISGDNMQDLKAGYLVGATPWRQQLVQGIGVVSAMLVMAPILNLLLQAYGIGPATDEQPDALLAPQATLMASVAQGVFGEGLPWNMVGLGVLIGIAIICLDEYLKYRRAKWRAPVLAVAVGIYLPLELAVPIFAGGVIAYFAGNHIEKKSAARSDSRRRGVLFGAGLITGEALIGILMAIPIVLTGDPEVFALGMKLSSLVGLAVIIIIAVTYYRIAIR